MALRSLLSVFDGSKQRDQIIASACAGAVLDLSKQERAGKIVPLVKYMADHPADTGAEEALENCLDVLAKTKSLEAKVSLVLYVLGYANHPQYDSANARQQAFDVVEQDLYVLLFDYGSRDFCLSQTTDLVYQAGSVAKGAFLAGHDEVGDMILKQIERVDSALKNSGVQDSKYQKLLQNTVRGIEMTRDSDIEDVVVVAAAPATP